MVKLTRADQLKLEADKKNKRSIPVKSKSVDFYDTDILGKSSKNTNPDIEKSKSGNKTEDDVKKYDLEFHEQYFS